jgi:hypothetical protein
MAVGYNYTGTLSIESGAFMRNAGEVVIGHGTSLQEYTSIVQVQNFTAPMPALGNWLILDNLTIGDFLRSELHISHGGQVYIFNDQSIIQAGLHAHPGSGFDAFININGSSDTASITSTLGTFGDVLLGMADGASVGFNVNHGGYLNVTLADLFLGFAPGSEAVMTVAGINGQGAPALVQVTRPDGNFTTGVCAIGEGGTGRLLIHSGGQVECGTIRIGGQPGSSGFVTVDGANGGSTLTTEGGLCIGGDRVGLCGASESGMNGTLEMKNGATVSVGRGTLVGPGGLITGNGDLSAGVLGLNVEEGGMLEPGVAGLTPEGAATFALNTIQTGALTVNGSVTISATGQVRLDVLGLENYDRLIVNGDVTLAGGTLTLAFGNGHAPRQGDTYDFFTAGAISGGFESVAITGLEPGFEYTISIVDGVLVLEALNDGVPTTSAIYRIFLPLAMRPNDY